MPTTFYTEKEYEEIRQKQRIYSDVLKVIDNAVGERLQGDMHKSGKRYHLIPNHNGDFLHYLGAVREDVLKYNRYIRQMRFLDAGCGIGIKVLLAYQFGFNGCASKGYSSGIELNDKYIEIGKLLLGERIIKSDILKFKDYNKFDVIYYYTPMKGELEAKFEELVEDKVKVGTYIIGCSKASCRIRDDGRFKKIHGDYPIWKRVRKRNK